MSQSYDANSSHTHKAYTGLDDAYTYFNKHLFKDTLPSCLITLQRKNGAYGYFSPDRFLANADKTHEIALNPSTFQERTQEQVLSTLAHEMVHLWQQHFGKPGRGNYHNKEFAEKMKTIGLQTVDHKTGAEVGSKVSHSIMAGALFQTTCAAFLKLGPFVLYADVGYNKAKAKKKAASKTKYTCPDCGCNVWGKPKMLIQCVECDETFSEEVMEDEPESGAA